MTTRAAAAVTMWIGIVYTWLSLIYDIDSWTGVYVGVLITAVAVFIFVCCEETERDQRPDPMDWES